MLASVASSRTDSLTSSGEGHLAALAGGYHVSFLLGAIFALSAAAIGVTFMRVNAATAGAHATPELAVEVGN